MERRLYILSDFEAIAALSLESQDFDRQTINFLATTYEIQASLVDSIEAVLLLIT
jgi:hypothetical protein